MTGEQLLFWIFALAACGGAIAVVATQNVVRMAFWLIVSLGSVAGLFFLLRAEFLGAVQMLIYVGGTVVLLVFGVMLTASGPYLRIRTSPAEGFLSAGIGALFLAVVVSTVLSVDWVGVDARIAARSGASVRTPSESMSTRSLGLSLMSLRPGRDLGSETASSSQLSVGYLLPFEIVSIHLLVVLVGAAYLARTKRKVDGVA